MNYKDVNDYEMLYLIGEKDEEAERILFGKYRNLIMKIAPKYLAFIQNRGGDFDDLVQEGYIGLYSAIKNYQASTNTLFYTFAHVCIERQMVTYCKKLSTNKNEVLNYSYSLDITLDDVRDPLVESIASAEKDPLESVVILDCIQRIIEFKNQLPDDVACVFELRMNGFTYQEIARLLDFSKSKVDSIMCRIRSRVQKTKLKEMLFVV